MSEVPPQLPDSPASASAHAQGGFVCPNCGRENEGKFCTACGQKQIHPGDLSLRHAWHHVGHEVAHLDGSLFDSLKLLFTRPGQLTLDFIEGRRVRQVHPIQLFLLFGVVFFFLAHVNAPVDFRAALEMRSNPAAAKLKLEPLMAGAGLTVDQFLDRANARMDAIFKTVETTAFLLQGFWLWVMFRRRRPFLAANIVTALHLACFSMTVWLTIGSLHWVGVSRIITTPLILVAGLVYFLLTARRVYGGSWLGLTGRWLILQLLRMAVILLAVIVVAVSVMRQAASAPVSVAVATVAPSTAVTPTQPIELFDGRSLFGWTLVARDVSTDPTSIWRAKNGVLYASAKPSGYARTSGLYRDYALHVEWRWPAAGGNCGIFLHLNGPDKLWPACLKVQLKAGEAGSLRALRGKTREVGLSGRDPSDVAARKPGVENPVGKWNTCDVVCRGREITVSINGVLENEIKGATVTAGAIALQTDGTPVEFRNLRLAPLPP